ncbi:NAD(P)-dependent oxidoreductase [Thermodesulfovibrio yellowstonii]|uniref:NAD(P)-dependent oxidoreductase n=2 Tax=Thermodesulfovibrio TaxID=28261 RepID=UPI001144C5C9|nr:NAD(P)-dependent oxidoreductase [Thermodesulfovibrio yellowstonii]MDI6864245.1 NAD(P)-dependent oxidoreductase [Thermodesulfovibrio yellowstonii]
MMKIGFIGLGNLGKAMAKRLISEGVELIVWNRTIDKAKELGCLIANTPSELISQVDMLILNLKDSIAVKDVLINQNGLIYGNCENKIVIDTTTNHFEEVLEFYSLLKEKRAYYLESPVLGSVIPASQGLLTVLVSGDKTAFERAKFILEKIGKSIFYLEKEGVATKMKLINNLVLGSFMATLAEAIVFAEQSGIDKERAIEILLSGAGNSMVLNVKKQKIIDEDFTPHFTNALIYKDLDYIHDLAKLLKRPLFTGSIVKEIYATALLKGVENEDFSSIYKIFKNF